MRPLDPLTHPELSQLTPRSDVDAQLRGSPPAEVEQELKRLAGLSLRPLEQAANHYAVGALALRRGRLNDAVEELDQAAQAFTKLDAPQAAALSRCESWLARIRRGPRKVYPEAAAALEQIGADDNQLVFVVSEHYRGTALRYSAQTEQTLEALLRAFQRSDGLLIERGQVLNSLGTLYQVMGAYGAAQAALEHAAEINHQVGDLVSEAISYGQLGSAALARDELKAARRHLQRQQWLASRVGDAFGEARSLVFLADLAIAMGRPDDALDLAQQAQQVATSVTPPLGMWQAYALRSEGRARLELQQDDAEEILQRAAERFATMGNQLGEALVGWDRALGRAAVTDAATLRQQVAKPAWALASLGLTGRLAQQLLELRQRQPQTEQGDELELDQTIAACGQVHPHVITAQEVDLVLKRPHTLATIASQRIAAQRNLGRLTACRLGDVGLYMAVVVAEQLQTVSALPSMRSAATLLGQLPGVALLAWRPSTPLPLIARDLSSLRVQLGEDTRAALSWSPDGKIASTPFAGEDGVALQGPGTMELLKHGLAAAPGTLAIVAVDDWNEECEGLAVMGGYEVDVSSR